MKRYAIIPAILLFAFVGCDREPPEPETPPPPPPTAQELLQRVIRATQLNAPLPKPGAELGKAEGAAWLKTVKSQRGKVAGEVNGAEAMRLVALKISERTRAEADLDLWSFVLVMCEAHKVFDPGSDKLDRLQKKAIRELSKPVVTFRQLSTKSDGSYEIQVDMKVPLTGQEFQNVTMSPGDIEHGVEFISVIGRSEGIRIEYEDGGDQLDIMR